MKKKIVFFAIVGFLFFFTRNKAWASQPQRPNIVLIIGDDIGWNDFGCYGNEQVHTPNIDRMAQEGIRFTNAYLTTSSSSPSRCSIISGRYPHNTGAAELHLPLPPHVPIFPEILKNSGYYTAQAGKWHMGEFAKRGFDLVRDEGKQVNGDGGEDQWVTLLKERPKEKPFFMWFASFDAHRPWGQNQLTGTNDPGHILTPPYLINDKDTRQDLAKYYDEVSRFDYFVGEVEKELKRQGISDNTVIIIMSDNGRPFPRCKTWLYEDGIKTPLVIKWPKGIKRNRAVSESLVSVIDLAPTILDVCATEPLACGQGKSFARLFQNPSLPFRNYVIAEHNWHDYEAYERMVCTEDYMYLYNGRPKLANASNGGLRGVPAFNSLLKAWAEGTLTPIQKDVFLSPRPVEAFFDLRKDPLQEHNLIDDPIYAKEVNHLRAVFKKWQKETGDTQPEYLTPDWYERFTPNGKSINTNKMRGEMPGASAGADTLCIKGPF